MLNDPASINLAILPWARAQRGLSVETLAEMVGVSPEAIHGCEQGSRGLSLSDVRVLANRLKLPYGYFWLGHTPTEPPISPEAYDRIIEQRVGGLTALGRLVARIGNRPHLHAIAAHPIPELVDLCLETRHRDGHTRLEVYELAKRLGGLTFIPLTPREVELLVAGFESY